MMSQESQPRASISSDDMGRKGAGVSLLAQKGLYEKISRGSPAAAWEGAFEGDGTKSPLPDWEDKVKGRFLGGEPTKTSAFGILPRGLARHGVCTTPAGWPWWPSPNDAVMHDDDDGSPR